MKFLRSPLRIEKPNENARLKMTFGVNELDAAEHVTDSGLRELEDCDLVFRSVGYKGKKLFQELPFDDARGIIPNDNGKVQHGKIFSSNVTSRHQVCKIFE